MVKGERGILSKNFKILPPDRLQNFILLFMSLLKAATVKNCHPLAVTYCIFVEKRPRPNSKNL